MMVGGVSKPSTRRPHSSFTEKEAGPRMVSKPRGRSQVEAASKSASAMIWSFSHSKKPKKPTWSPWIWL